MKKNLLSLFCALCALLLIPNTGKAAEETVTTGTDAGGHTLVPVGANTTALGGASVNYATQQLYLASELGGASKAGNITAISFHYKTGTNYMNARSSWKLYINTTSATDLEDNTFLDKGTLVYTSTSFNVPNSDSWYKLDFSSPFAWNGTSNIVITIIDESNTTMPTSKSHWAYTTSAARSIYLRKGADEAIPNPLTGTTSTRKDSYVANAKFTIYLPDASAPSTPEDLSVSATMTTSASLSWSAVEGATSYDLQQSANGEDWSTLVSGETGTSYSWTGLSAASTQYARIRANNAIGSSDWSDAVTVATDPLYEYDNITFDKWTSSNSLPSSGNRYLNADVALGSGGTDLTLTDDLNLCLNGHVANLTYQKIIIPDGMTLTIYNNSLSEGKITSVVAGQIETFETNFQAVIVVKSGGTLVLKEGVIENNFVHDPTDPSDVYSSYAIYSNGTVKLSGDVMINSNDADICLHSTNVITINGAIFNAEKHSVHKMGGNITSGWSTYMSGEDPKDFFSSANPDKSICLNGSEVALRTLLNLSDLLSNSSIGDNFNQLVDVNLTRTLTSSQFNTFCLPFALSNAQLEEIFGAGYDLEELASSSLDDDLLTLSFNKVTALVAGKPYLLQPSVNVSNPSFEGVTIAATSPVNTTTDCVDFKGVYAPTSLEGGNHNLLFLGADNELFWPESTGNLKGFRAYFELKGGAGAVARRARIVQQGNTATGIESQQLKANSQKLIKNGQLLILRDNKTYNVLGMECK